MKIKRKVVKAILGGLVRFFYRVKIEGEENLPKNGTYMMCGNHVHALDAPVLVLTCKRHINFIAKEELFKSAFLRFLGRTFDVISVKRDSADMEAMKKSMKVLKDENAILGLFPEGTRNGMEKHTEIKTGAAFMALKTNTPVIPVAFVGSFKLFRKVIVRYGKPLDFSEYVPEKGKPDKDTLELVSKKIMDSVVELRDEKV